MGNEIGGPLSLQNRHILLAEDMDKDQISRMRFFIEWINSKRIPWYQPELAAYRDYLLKERTRRDPATGEQRPAPLSVGAASAHLSTIRARYRSLINDNRIRDWLYQALPGDVVSPADRKALVDEVYVRMRNAIAPETSSIKRVEILDHADSDHLRLTPEQVRRLIRQPGLDTLTGLRDTAIIALLACTGIREAELVALNVRDLRETFGGELSLCVRDGKDNRQRIVPYGDMAWCLDYVNRWLESAGITSGPVFRGFYKGGKHVRPMRISLRAVNQIMHRYPIMIGHQMRVVQPHDLRRTYARNAYLAGMDLERIRQNLGHTSLQTTQIYVGALDALQRRPPEMFVRPHPEQELK